LARFLSPFSLSRDKEKGPPEADHIAASSKIYNTNSQGRFRKLNKNAKAPARLTGPCGRFVVRRKKRELK
jgi:hypothetical protein